jgi:hypothetical protein
VMQLPAKYEPVHRVSDITQSMAATHDAARDKIPNGAGSADGSLPGSL